MPRRSTLMRLSREQRAALDARLVEIGFQDYDKVLAWLREQGHEVSRSALHRHGKKLEKILERRRWAAEISHAIDAAGADDGNLEAQAVMRLGHGQLLSILSYLDEMDPKSFTIDDARKLAALLRDQAASARVGVVLRAEQLKAEARREAAVIVREEGRAQGLSPDLLDAIDARLMPQ